MDISLKKIIHETAFELWKDGYEFRFSDHDYHDMNMVFALHFGIISWAQYFEYWKNKNESGQKKRAS